MIKILYNCICIIPLIYVLSIIFMRIFFSNNSKIKNLIKIEEHDSYAPTKKECGLVFLYAIGFRILIFIFSIVIYYIFLNNNTTYHINFNINDVILSWEKWDSAPYIRISHGYDFYTENGDYNMLVFFPLYPFLMNFLNNFTNNIHLAGILVSSISYSIACIFIYKLVCFDYGKSIAKKALVLISIFPFAFFFGGIMSDSLLLLFLTISLYAIRVHKWKLVGISGFLASISRIQGAIIIFPALIEIITHYQVLEKIKNKDIKFLINLFFRKVLPLILIPCGVLYYFSINYKITGDWFYFLTMQKKYWYQEYTPFYLIINTLMDSILGGNVYFNLTVFMPQLATVIFIYALLVIGGRKHNSTYLTLLLTYIIFSTSTNRPLSLVRYFCCALPAFIFLADICDKKPKLYTFFVVTFSILFGIYFIAFFEWRNIM